MSVRSLTVLGTSSQVPTRYRNHNGYYLRWDNEGILFDPGEGTQRQMIFAGIAPSQITKICITHFHGDHCLGLPGLIQRLSLARIKHPIDIFYPASGEIYLDRLCHASIFYDTMEIRKHPIGAAGIIWETEQTSITALPLEHTVDTYGYRISEKDGYTFIPEKLLELGIIGPAVGELKNKGTIVIDSRVITSAEVGTIRPGQHFAFIMDTRYCENAVTLAEKTDVVLCESTYLDEDRCHAWEHGHLSAAQAAFVARTGQAKRLILAHFSQKVPNNEAFAEEACLLHPNTIAACDGQTIAFSRPRRVLSPSLP